MEQLQEHWPQILGAVAIIVVIAVLAKFLSSRKKVFAEGMTLNVRCRKCRWKGTVTKYNQVCRSCNSTDLQTF